MSLALNNKPNLLYKNIEGVDFSDYPSVYIENSNKPKINFSTNTFTSEYKSRILELYKNSKVNFGGHYIIIYWNAGMGTS